MTAQIDRSGGCTADDRELAAGFASFLVGSRAGGFVGGAAGLCALWVASGRGQMVEALALIAWPFVPYAIVAGVLLSWCDWRRVLRHQVECAEIERARKPASRAFWSLSRSREFHRVAHRHQRVIWVDWLSAFLAAAAFLILAGMAGGLLIWATLYGTEALLWFLVWRPSLLRNVTSGAHKEVAQ